MFTGLVREIGSVEAIEAGDGGVRLRVSSGLADSLAEGASIAVSGACLTATEVNDRAFAADVMNQTLSRTTLGGLEPGGRVNLEPALRAGEPLGGHLVQGHVDAVATVGSTQEDGFARRIAIELPAELRRYVVEHGSVAVDGVSLTVANLRPDGFEVSLIPETLERTTLGDLEGGSRVNVEVDQIARYAERLMSSLGKEGTDG